MRAPWLRRSLMVWNCIRGGLGWMPGKGSKVILLPIPPCFPKGSVIPMWDPRYFQVMFQTCHITIDRPRSESRKQCLWLDTWNWEVEENTLSWWMNFWGVSVVPHWRQSSMCSIQVRHFPGHIGNPHLRVSENAEVEIDRYKWYLCDGQQLLHIKDINWFPISFVLCEGKSHQGKRGIM